MTEIAPGSIDASDLGDEVDAFSKRLGLEDIQLVRWSGKVREGVDDVEPKSLTAELRGHYRFHGQFFQCRWSVKAPLTADGRPVAEIAATFVETFVVTDGPKPSGDVLQAFMKECALPVAMPYVREAVQNMSSKLGLGSVVLGLFHIPGHLPYSASFKRYRFHDLDGQLELPLESVVQSEKVQQALTAGDPPRLND